MSAMKYDLYIDESGDFEKESKFSSSSPSLVGGLLIPSNVIDDSYLNALLSGSVHAMEEYDKEKFFTILERLRSDKGHFLIFQNEERLKVVNGDMTYLNVLSEGLVQLMRNLRVDYPDKNIELNVLIASRQAVSYKQYIYGEHAEGYNIQIEQDQYYARLEEKLILSMGKSQIQGIELKTSFASATKDKRLMLADIICNTFYSKASQRKFTDEDRQKIDALFEEKYIYSVFENATIGNLKRLFIESRYGEMLYQICILPKPHGIDLIRNQLIKQIANEKFKEREVYFSYMSLQISQYNNHRMFSDGIRFAENYKKNILKPMREYQLSNVSNAEQIAYQKQIDYWTFDTDFYILTMYDHLGNPAKCAAFLDICRANISIINQTWEHVDYYLKYCIRELNCIIGQFDFEKVLEKSDNLLRILQDAKDLFGMIGAYDNTGSSPKSDLLGKVYGIRLEAYLNLLCENMDYYHEAVNASDAALSEFSFPEDLRRQYQYRCQLMVEAGKVEDAIDCLFKSFGESDTQLRDYKKLVEMVYKNQEKPAIFSLFHYTNVMRLMAESHHEDAGNIFEALTSFRAFSNDLENDKRNGHPWNLIVWNMYRWYAALGKTVKAEAYYKKAMKITQANPDNVTMYTFSVSMAAEHLLYCIRNNLKTRAAVENDYVRACTTLNRHDLPQKIASIFRVPEGSIKESDLEKVARHYLK